MLRISRSQKYADALDCVWTTICLVRLFCIEGACLQLTPPSPRDVKKQAAKFPPTSVTPILGSSPNLTIITAAVRPNGAPVIQLSDGVAHSYDGSLCVWTKLSEPWWAEGSDAWQGRQRSNNQGARGPLMVLEGAISERMSVGLKTKKYTALSSALLRGVRSCLT